MAEVTKVLPDEHIPGAIGPLTMILGKVTIAATGDTWTHGLRATLAYGFNDVAITKMAGDTNQCTITSTGAVTAAKVWALGYA